MNATYAPVNLLMASVRIQVIDPKEHEVLDKLTFNAPHLIVD